MDRREDAKLVVRQSEQQGQGGVGWSGGGRLDWVWPMTLIRAPSGAEHPAAKV